MDFSGQFAFPGPHHHGFHQFMPVPPLTPSTSQSAHSDSYTNSPPDTYDSVSVSEGFPGFEFAPGFHPQQHPQTAATGFVGGHAGGPPTPPSQGSYTAPTYPTHGHYGSISHINGDLLGTKSEVDDNNGNSRGSEEDNLTPAQSKRKAQNRAAQRAFRERKEKHVKDLEAKLADLEAAQQQASLENERLKRDLQRITTENEILKATSSSNSSNPGATASATGPGSTAANGLLGSHSPEPITTTGPMRYSPTDFASSVLAGHDNKSFSHRVAYAKDGQRLLAAGASWDFIINHDLFKRGLVDIGSVSEHLRTRAVCDGQGPVFSENDVLEAIEMSVASGSDELL